MSLELASPRPRYRPMSRVTLPAAKAMKWPVHVGYVGRLAKPGLVVRVPADSRLIDAFYQGQACSQRDGYRSDNPHVYGGDLWLAWLVGFEYEEGPLYKVAEPKKGTG